MSATNDAAASWSSENLDESKQQSQSENVDIRQQIANLAYSLWQQRGEVGGSAEQDWRQAEQQIRDWDKTATTRR